MAQSHCSERRSGHHKTPQDIMTLNNQQVEAEELIHEGAGDVIVGKTEANIRAAKRLAIAVCSMLTLLGACKLPASKLSNARIPDSKNGTSLGLNVQPMSCCGQGLCAQGACLVGGCVVGSPQSTCCAARASVVCSPGSSCNMNRHGSAFCCPPGYRACQGICVEEWHARSIIATGGSCDSSAPQGLSTGSQTIFVNADWNGEHNFYDFIGNTTIIAFPPFRFRDGDFTLGITVVPRNDRQITLGSPGGRAVLMARSTVDSILSQTGYALIVNQFRSGDARIELRVVRNQNILSVVSVAGNVQDPWRAKIPVKIKAVRQGPMFYMFVNGMEVGSRNGGLPVDVDSDVVSHFVIGITSISNINIARGLNCGLSDIRALPFAEMP